jgi:hypothetical protein
MRRGGDGAQAAFARHGRVLSMLHALGARPWAPYLESDLVPETIESDLLHRSHWEAKILSDYVRLRMSGQEAKSRDI